MSKPLIKSVFCSYRGVLVVHDIHGNRVGDLCGEMTLEKYNEIEERVADITEFDGLDNYKRIAAELEEAIPVGEWQGVVPELPITPSQPIDIEILNTTNEKMPVVLFGAYHNYKSSCFGNKQGLVLSAGYKSILSKTMVKPLMVKSILFDDCTKIGETFEIKKTNFTGGTMMSSVIISNHVSATHLGPTVVVNLGQIVIDGATEINFEIKEKSSLKMKLYQ